MDTPHPAALLSRSPAARAIVKLNECRENPSLIASPLVDVPEPPALTVAASSAEGSFPTPTMVLSETPVPPPVQVHVQAAQDAVKAVIAGHDDRLIVVVGPCSIHDVKAAKEYALWLHQLKLELSSDLVIVMRTYFEKPRTTVGWKGLINDPELNGSFQIDVGLWAARQLLLDVATIGLPCAIEFLDVLSPKYLQDLITWGAIGARTTECQLHREVVSGLPCAIGFKNATNGSVKVAIDAIQAASASHSFLGLNLEGRIAVTNTPGNHSAHGILRGGLRAPTGTPAQIMIDCSHGNSQGPHKE